MVSGMIIAMVPPFVDPDATARVASAHRRP
jgi:hypothetical protein